MSTPPNGENPPWRPAPDESPTTPQPQRPDVPESPAGFGAPGSGQPVQPGPPAQPGSGQPQYAPPQYGQPPPGSSWGPPGGQPPGYHGAPAPAAWAPPAEPRDRRKRLLVIALAVVALLIAAGIALLVYVLSSTRLDRAAVQRDVAAQFEERTGVGIDLECNRLMVVRVGADYECEGTTADGEDVEIRIVITSDEGAYTWQED